MLTREEQIRQHKQEALATWETLTRRIEALKRDLALELDGQHQVVLAAQLAELEQRRGEAEVELQRWEQELQALAPSSADEVEFVNRENELQLLQVERLRAARSPYTLISAPAGYGKSYLLRRLIAVSQADRDLGDMWAFRYMDFRTLPEDQVNQIAQALSGRPAAVEDATCDLVCDAVIRELAAPIEGGRKAVLLIFDAVEQLGAPAQQWLYQLFHALRTRTCLDHRELIVVRILVAGRNPEPFWEGFVRAYPSLLAPQRLTLTPFDAHSIQELVWGQAEAVQIALDDQTAAQIADEVGYLSGGHPGAIRSLVDHLARRSFAVGPVREYFDRQRAQLVRACISPVAEGLLAGFDADLRHVVRTLSVFRRINANSIQALEQAGELPPSTDEIALLGQLQKAHLLSGPTIQDPFFRDHVTRRVLAVDMAFGGESDPARYQRLNKIALDMYGGWILDVGQALPGSHLKSLQRLLSVVEWLFHALQAQEIDEQALSDGLQRYIQSLSQAGQPLSVADLIVDHIQQDAEVCYLIRHRLGEGGIQIIYNWAHSSR